MRNGKLHVVLGIQDEKTVEELKKALIQAGYDDPIVVRKALKLSVMEYIEKNRDVDALILQEGLESSNYFQMVEYARFLDLINNLIIIPILTDETMRNKNMMLELYNNQLLTAVFNRVSLTEIIKLIQNGRTRVAARQYYGLTSLEVENSEHADYESSVQYIIYEKSPLKERLDFIKKRVNNNDFKIILSKLPRQIVEEALTLPEYAGLVRGCYPELNVKEKNLQEKNRRSSDAERTSYVNSPVLVDYQTAVKKVVIGFTGTQEHIGSTFNTIAFANYLAGQNYKVAVLEDKTQKNLAIDSLRKHEGAVSKGNCFTYKGVDYYPNYDLSEITEILLIEGYNFVIIDFGLFRTDILLEFNRCVLPIIVSGSKPWEFPYMERVFASVEKEEILANYHYLFSFTAPAVRRTIIKNMGVLKNVYFSESLSNPLSGSGFPAMESIVGSYLPVVVSAQEKGVPVFKKMKNLFGK